MGDPGLRLGAWDNGQDVLAHPFFRNVDMEALLRKEIPAPRATQAGETQDGGEEEMSLSHANFTSTVDRMQSPNVQPPSAPVSALERAVNGNHTVAPRVDRGEDFTDFTFVGDVPARQTILRS